MIRGMVVMVPMAPDETPRSLWMTSASGPTQVKGARRQNAVAISVTASPTAMCDLL